MSLVELGALCGAIAVVLGIAQACVSIFVGYMRLQEAYVTAEAVKELRLWIVQNFVTKDTCSAAMEKQNNQLSHDEVNIYKPGDVPAIHLPLG
jgi:hypothetical protein